MATSMAHLALRPWYISFGQANSSINGTGIFTYDNFFKSAGPHKTDRFLSFNPRIFKRRSSTLANLIAEDSTLVTEDNLKLATFVVGSKESQVGVVHHGHIWPLQQVVSHKFNSHHINDMIDVINHWHLLQSCLFVDDSWKLEGSGIKLADVKLLAPLPRPSGAIMCIGKNYVDHVKEIDTWKTAPGIAAPDIPKYPIIFTKAPQSIVGPGAAVKYPHGVSTQVDYETELAVIIGKPGRAIKREDAMSHVFGYTILNDVTARDLQKKHQQWFMGKSCDTFCPMGPWIIPATEINGQDLRLQCWVNGELRQDARTSQMIFSIPLLIETISAGITLHPGDIIATGTPSGVGSGFDPPRHLVPGDSICMKIEGIGELHNYII